MSFQDEVVSDFVEACGGVGAMKNLVIVYKIIALIKAEKEASLSQNKQELFYDDSKNSYVEENKFYDELRGSRDENERQTLSRPSTFRIEPNVTSGHLYLQIENEKWQKMLVVIQKGILKCYDAADRKWKVSYSLKSVKFNTIQENYIFLKDESNKEIVFENREESSLTQKKWVDGIVAHMEYAESGEVFDLERERRDSLAFLASGGNSNNNSPQIGGILSELKQHLMEMILKGIEEAEDDEEYKLGLKTALGKLYQIEDNFEKAEALFNESLEGRKNILGFDHFFTISSMDDMVEVCIASRNYEKAVNILGDALEIRREKLGNAHPATLICMNNLAFLYEQLGLSIKSELLYRECCDIFVSEYGTDHPHSVLAMKNLAYLFFKHKKYDFAEEVFRGCYEQELELLGIDHSETFVLLRNLINVYLTQGKMNEVKKLYSPAQECLKIREEKLGIDHAATIAALNLVSFLSMKLGKIEEAERNYVAVVKFRKLRLGISHPDTIAAMNNLATLYFNQEKFNLALPLFNSILDHARIVSSNSNINNDVDREFHQATLLSSLSNLGNTYYYLQDFAKAETFLVEMIKIIKETESSCFDNRNRNSSLRESQESIIIEQREYYNDNFDIGTNVNIVDTTNPFVLTSYTNLANIYFRKKQFDLAEPLYVKSLEVRKQKLGENNLETLSSMKNLGVLYMSMKKVDESIIAFKECYERRKSILGVGHVDTIIMASYLGNMYNTKQQFDLATPLYLEYIENTKEKPMDDVSCVVINNLGIIYYRNKSPEKAFPLLEQVVDYKRRKLGNEDPGTIFCLGNLAAVYKAVKKFDLAEKLYKEVYEAKKKSLGEQHAETTAALNNLTLIQGVKK